METVTNNIAQINKKMKMENISFVYKEIDNSSCKFLYHYNRKTVTQVSEKMFRDVLLTTKYRVKMFRIKNNTYACMTESNFRPQGLGDIYNFIMDKYVFIKGVATSLTNDHFKAWLLDVLTVILDLSDPLMYGPKRLVITLTRLYSLLLRLIDFRRNNTYYTQALGLGDVSFMAAVVGLPSVILEKLKIFQTLASLRVSSLDLFFDILVKFCDLVVLILDYIEEKLPGTGFIVAIRKVFVSTFGFMKNIEFNREMLALYKKYTTNSQIMFDATFRDKVMAFDEKVRDSIEFKEYLNRPTNKHLLEIYKAFNSNILRYVKTFTLSSRSEPVCFVFEGAAGCGKSRLMNKLVAVLKHMNKSVYVHSVPPTDSGKDFYDDYENQEVFVVDDMGQQGLSQWRNVINWVSPVKYPLDCATAEKKNTKFFNSDLILATTNQFTDIVGFTSKDGISSKEALFRRCHVIKFQQVEQIGNYNMEYLKYNYRGSGTFENSFMDGNEILNGTVPLNKITNNDNHAIQWILQLLITSQEVQKVYSKRNEMKADDMDSIIAGLIVDLPNAPQLGFSIPEVNLNEIQAAVKTIRSSSVTSNSTFEDAKDDYQPQMIGSMYGRPIHPGEVQSPRDIRAVEQFELDETYEVTLVDYQEESLSFSTVVREFVANIASKMKDSITTLFTYIGNVNFKELVSDVKFIGAVAALLSVVFLKMGERFILKRLDDVPEHKKNVIAKLRTDVTYNGKYYPQSQLPTTAFQKQTMFAEIFSQDSKDMTISCKLHCSFSGKRFITAYHALGTGPFYMNVYKTWDDYVANVMILNQQRFKILESYPHLDLVVCELDTEGPPPFKTLHFSEKEGMVNTFSLMNSESCIDMAMPYNISLNDESISYTNRHGKININKGDGYVYTVNADGLCGSLLVGKIGNDHVLAGVHIAGNGDKGVSVILPNSIRKQIMRYLENTQESKYEILDKKRENYSGCRLFQDNLQSQMPASKSSLAPSILYDIVEQPQFKNEIDYAMATQVIDPIIEKLPANLSVYGNKTLPRMSVKSFKVVPHIDNDEIEFAKECLRSMLTRFTKLDEDTAAFGDDFFEPLNKDSVNGYGYKKEKKEYLDYETRTIKEDFVNKINDFKRRVASDTLRVEDILSYEALKDELRPIGKEIKPRCFRVMPLHHTFLLKQLIGNLFKHCRKNMWSNGIALGMNPYQDWDKLYYKLNGKKLKFDGDFGSYDGSAPPQLQDAIKDVVLEFFDGTEEDTRLFQVLLSVIIRSYVLVKEELYLTTHSLPSGCWVTGFFNSLLNRALTAICLFRNMKKVNKVATVELWQDIVDFVCGDDKIVGVSPYTTMEGEHVDLTLYVNALTMKQVAESFGMTYTDALKGDITEPGKEMKDLQFLKRKFVFHRKLEKFVGILDMSTITQSLRFFDTTKDYSVVLSGKLTAFQFEMSLYESLGNLKDFVLDFADARNIQFKRFDESHIFKSMCDEDTYRIICRCNSKFFN